MSKNRLSGEIWQLALLFFALGLLAKPMLGHSALCSPLAGLLAVETVSAR